MALEQVLHDVQKRLQVAYNKSKILYHFSRYERFVVN